MAQMTGYVCDICSTFTTNRDRWLKVSSFTDNRVTDTGWDICSNKCLVNLGRTRLSEGAGANGGTKPPKSRRNHSDEFKAEIAGYINNDKRKVYEVGRAYNLSPSLVRRWADDFEGEA